MNDIDDKEYYDKEAEAWHKTYLDYRRYIQGGPYIPLCGIEYQSPDDYYKQNFPNEYLKRKYKFHIKNFTKEDSKQLLKDPTSSLFYVVIKLFSDYAEIELSKKVTTIEEAEMLGFHNWYNNILWEPEALGSNIQTNRPPAERTTFIKALEDAFWEANGPELLVNLAKTNPLEFLKICAKLIDPSAKTPNAALEITFNIQESKKSEKVVTPINLD